MLSKEHSEALGDPVADAISAYEIDLLNAMAKELMSLKNLTPYEINKSALEVRRKAMGIRLAHSEQVAKSARKVLNDGFMVNLVTELP